MSDTDLTGSRESGFGVIEIIVSMFLLALLAIAFLPLLITSLQVTVTNAQVATATQLVTRQLEQIGAAGSSCSAVKALVAVTPAPVADPNGELQPRHALGLPAGDVCAAPYLRTVSLRVWVTETGSSDVLAEARTLVLLDVP